MLRRTFALLASTLAFLGCGARSTLTDDATSSPVTVGGGDAGTVDGGDAGTSVAACHCDDGIACTRDVCQSDASCTHLPDDESCGEGDLCTASGCSAGLYVTVVRDATLPRLATLDLKDGTVTLVGGPSALMIYGIAMRANGTLIALTDSGLATLDRSTGVATVEHPLPSFANETGFAAGPDDDLFGLSDASFFRLDHKSLAIDALTPFPPPTHGAGDLAFAQGILFASVRNYGSGASHMLGQIDPSTGTLQQGPFIGFSCVDGLATSHGTLYGVTCNGFVLYFDAAGAVGTRFHTTDVFDDAAGR